MLTPPACTPSKRGLTIPDGWCAGSGPLLLVEGPSDVLALAAAGLAAVGRPSNTGGVAHLAELLAAWPRDRDVLVVGENDRRDDQWPGRDGAHRTAAALQSHLGRVVTVAMPPGDAKDVRAWLTGRAAGGADWASLGRELLAHLIGSAAPVKGARRPEIVVTTEEHAVNDAAVAALPGAEGVYTRGGLLVHVLELEAPAAVSPGVRQPAGATVVRELSPPLLREQFTRVADWVRVVETKEGTETVPTHPTGWCVQAVHARGCWPGVRPLEAVVTHPVLLPDGSLLAVNRYYRPTGVLVRLPRGLTLSVPDAPTRADAAAAVELLFDAVCDFPFERPEHRAAWLAGLLSPLAWFAFDGPAPFFLIDGYVRGVGKGLLADAIALPVLGRRFSAMTYTPDRDELRKRITSVAAEGERMVLLDNLAGAIGNDQLDAALTADRWKDRLLGGNRVFDGPLNVVWYGTGNNCELRADTSRRTCHVRMESTDERPEERGGFRYPKLREHLKRHRNALLSAALTVLRAWVAAGRPRHGLPPWGSYESWSEVVREAVAFAGQPDPGLTRVALQTSADRNALAMGALLRGLTRLDPDRRGQTVSDIVELAKSNPDVRSAVEDLAGRLDTRALRYSLRSFVRRNFEGMFLDVAATTGQGVRWAVFPMSEFRRAGTSPPSPPSSHRPDGDGGDGGDGPARGPHPDGLFDASTGGLPD
ncbi:Bifunctional DNA Primase/polymerase OS=Myxococcus stipitatus (strain DSM 14675 / JCM 12634 / Mx s8) GN=MYSTI_01949 PE=4 SV=1 [Gemmataceae bacterium]|nr:Bifunctional DNA Primase/polymerase OS=Myxococcus stipitatus (strain DSM 14675 / JCM 12634 / Mx s8) GN=MYSTI_01949 PE=4 SV=1 [Gemmataceae bacterium]VTU00305.1 Bifunctional DNA Primase/polymerase OS=Myxococcus stipitatus (strain DSM 14675 / JCM 12634 / Mx s8) GN=MYSTI_01949 PE=4 SV=1 [Gemmataceae bacterium]